MTKKNILYSLLLVSGLSYAQVGYNTSVPKATFDITAKNSTGNFATSEGLLLPRVDRQKAQSMTGVQNSTLIYVNNISTGTQTGTAVNINTTGYYYFSGSAWVKWNTISTTDTNIYNKDGTLTNDRKVDNGDKTIAITGTVRNMFSVDGSTFSADAANKRIGIVTSSPMNKLDLGTTDTSLPTDAKAKKLAIYNSNNGDSFYGLGTSGTILHFHAGSDKSDAPKMVLNSARNVGLGTTSAASNLHVNGSVKITDGTEGEDKVLTTDADGVAIWQNLPESFILKNFYNSDGSLTSNRTVTQGNYLLGFAGAVQTNAFSVAGTTFSVDAAAHRIGMGTSTPQNLLDMGSDLPAAPVDPESKKIAVYNNAAGSAFYGLGASTNKLLFHANSASDAAPAMVLTNDGNVGIGNTDPAKSSILDISSTTKGFLPTRLTLAQRDALNPIVPGLMIYNKDSNCMQYWNSLKWVDNCPLGTIGSLACTTATHNGSLVPGIPASNVSSVISYTGGDGKYYPESTFTSTGVTGLTAKLLAGNFAIGNGTLTFTITGTPSEEGNAIFNINIGGQTCTLTRTVTNLPPAPDLSSSCTGWRLIYQGNNSSSSGTVNGLPVTATFTNYNNITNHLLFKSCLITTQTANSYWLGLNKVPSSMRIQFNRAVSNIKIYQTATGPGEVFTYTLRKGGVAVSPTIQVASGFPCNSSFTISGNRVIANNNDSNENRGIIYNIGGVYFDEIVVNHNGTMNGSIINWCIGAAQ